MTAWCQGVIQKRLNKNMIHVLSSGVWHFLTQHKDSKRISNDLIITAIINAYIRVLVFSIKNFLLNIILFVKS